MKTEIKTINGVESLVITLPLQTPKLSSTGKSKIVAGGNGYEKTNIDVKGKQVSVSAAAIIKAD